MKKIPTLYVRDFTDPSNGRYVAEEVTPGCEWVLDGEGTPTRKYDGTCMMFDGNRWWARREVKAGKTPPPNFVPVETDGTTGKTVGWEPVEQSAFAKHHMQALADEEVVGDWPDPWPVPGGSYELIGPRVNGNPEQVGKHILVRHGYMSSIDAEVATTAGRQFADLELFFAAHPTWEGIVWHHPDGRLAKIKARDLGR